MGNICSIFHKHYEILVALTGSHKKAVFLDKCIFWWQLSNYTLNDNQIWFTRSIATMAQELSFSERTVSRYLQDLVEKGLLKRTCKLSASNKSEQFKVIKRLYICITEKLLEILQSNSLKNRLPISQKTETDKNFCLPQNGKIEKANLAKPIYKDQYYKNHINCTVSQSSCVDNKKRRGQSIYPFYAIEKLIGERIDERTKNYIKSIMINLQTQHGILFSSPEQTFAEIVFSISNQDQLKNVENLNHKMQIIAKLLREKRWLTPKGFYNHSDYGHYFKQRRRGSDFILAKDTVNGARFSPYKKNSDLKKKKAQLQELESLFLSEERYLREAIADRTRGLDRTFLIQSIQNKRHKLKDELTLLRLEVHSLNQTIKPAFQQGRDWQLQKTSQLNSLIKQAEQLRQQSNHQFEVVCQKMELLQKGHPDIDKEYEVYQHLNSELKLIENQIVDLEYELYNNNAA